MSLIIRRSSILVRRRTIKLLLESVTVLSSKIKCPSFRSFSGCFWVLWFRRLCGRVLNSRMSASKFGPHSAMI